jgi:hypothetical protein
MTTAMKKQRYVVSHLGFAFAVHDTAKRQEYAFEAGREKTHKSSNELNGERIELFPTREEAERFAYELNRRHESQTGGSSGA